MLIGKEKFDLKTEIVEDEELKYVEIDDEKFYFLNKLPTKKTIGMLKSVFVDNVDLINELQKKMLEMKGINRIELFFELDELIYSLFSIYFGKTKVTFEDMDVTDVIKLANTFAVNHSDFFTIFTNQVKSKIIPQEF